MDVVARAHARAQGRADERMDVFAYIDKLIEEDKVGLMLMDGHTALKTLATIMRESGHVGYGSPRKVNVTVLKVGP
jgi:hypothetical protein